MPALEILHLHYIMYIFFTRVKFSKVTQAIALTNKPLSMTKALSVLLKKLSSILISDWSTSQPALASGKAANLK